MDGAKHPLGSLLHCEGKRVRAVLRGTSTLGHRCRAAKSKEGSVGPVTAAE